METTFDLKESPAPVELREAGIVLIAPGLRGKGSYAGKREAGQTRAFTGEHSALDAAIREADLEDCHTLTLAAPTPEPQPGAGTRAGLQMVENDAMLLQVPGKADEFQFAIYTDEAGVITFHYPQKLDVADALPSRAFGVSHQYQYKIPLRKAYAPAEEGSRGLFGMIGSKIVKIVAGKLLAKQTGKVAHWLIRKWEDSHRCFQGLHGGKDFAELMQCDAKPFDQWDSIRGKKALLFIHGTSSCTSGAFAGLQSDANAAIPKALYKRYAGRVLAFNHHTMSVGVADNVKQFYEAFSGHPGEYHFDIVCHSRGGLVARALTQLPDAFLAQRLDGWQRPADVKIKVDRIVFVATPNGGTNLAKPGNIPDAIELLANYVNMLPDGLLSISAGMLLSLASAVAEAGLPYVPGLEDQAPDSELVRALADSQADATRYYGFEACFTTVGGLLDAAGRVGIFPTSVGLMVQTLFGDEANDMVVPTAGVGENSHFKLADGQVARFKGGHVHHTNFFFQPEIHQMLDFLPG